MVADCTCVRLSYTVEERNRDSVSLLLSIDSFSNLENARGRWRRRLERYFGKEAELLIDSLLLSGKADHCSYTAERFIDQIADFVLQCNLLIHCF